MKNDKEKFKIEMKRRIYRWTLALVALVDSLSDSQSSHRIVDQLIRSGTSVGANYIESQAASSKKILSIFCAMLSNRRTKVHFGFVFCAIPGKRTKKKQTSCLTNLSNSPTFLAPAC